MQDRTAYTVGDVRDPERFAIGKRAGMSMFQKTAFLSCVCLSSKFSPFLLGFLCLE